MCPNATTSTGNGNAPSGVDELAFIAITTRRAGRCRHDLLAQQSGRRRPDEIEIGVASSAPSTADSSRPSVSSSASGILSSRLSAVRSEVGVPMTVRPLRMRSASNSRNRSAVEPVPSPTSCRLGHSRAPARQRARFQRNRSFSGIEAMEVYTNRRHELDAATDNERQHDANSQFARSSSKVIHNHYNAFVSDTWLLAVHCLERDLETGRMDFLARWISGKPYAMPNARALIGDCLRSIAKPKRTRSQLALPKGRRGTFTARTLRRALGIPTDSAKARPAQRGHESKGRHPQQF